MAGEEHHFVGLSQSGSRKGWDIDGKRRLPVPIERGGGKRPLVMMQNQGLYNCFNTLRAVCLDAHIPMVFMVGQFGREFSNIGHPTSESARSMVRIAEPFLASIGVPYHLLDKEEDLMKLDQAYEQAQQQRTAVVLLVGAPMAWR